MAVTPEDRFLSKVEKTETCWLWLAGISRGGYGKFKLNRKTRLAHRVSYEMFVGPIPDGLQLDHLCRVRSCVNPAHLEAVTCRENLLRGATFNALNVAKTHCPQGHPYAGANLLITSESKRLCAVCRKAKSRASYLRRLGAAA